MTKTCVLTVQPEFTQIDVETSFMTAPQVREVMEALVRHLWLEVKGVDLGDFPVMTLRKQNAVMVLINRICVTRWN
ncbi:aspartyl-tRNA synthetase [Escherichia coli]|uniref:Aspartyl-tRNA synthetase n=1 Tax=Escherichia coli TaxID=562 RepID=A0A377BCT3_ECOLX|nr:aspartyl-tRNA synthetase [Escherichia coli]